MDVIGYLRCSTKEQASEGYSLEAQRLAITKEADHRAWNVVHWIEDPGTTGKTMQRPGIQYALSLLRNKQADALVVTKLDRLARSVAGTAEVLGDAAKQGWAIVIMDLNIDSTTYTGRMVLHVLAAVAEWEVARISHRTSEGMAVARTIGHVPGRARATSPDVVRRIVRARTKQQTYRAIAADLNRDGIPTSKGKQWQPGTVRMVLQQEDML